MMHARTETIDVYNDLGLTSSRATKKHPASQMYLTVPEDSEIEIIIESPVDRFGPPLAWDKKARPVTNITTRSSVYSRNTEGYSLNAFEWDGIGIDEDEAYNNDQNHDANTSITGDSIQWEAPMSPLSITGNNYLGSNSRLILQGLSDPYRTGLSPASNQFPDNAFTTTPNVSTTRLDLPPAVPPKVVAPAVPPKAAIADTQRMRKLAPSPIQIKQESWLERSRELNSSSTSISMSSPMPVRPQRESVVSPSFRKPTSLLSPFKTPPSFMSTSSPLAYSSTETSTLYLESKCSYPSGRDLILIIISVAVATFCTALDRIIIITAVPQITDQFNTIEDVGWYGSAYLLTACSTYLLYGKLYRACSTKWLYITSLGIFELGSLISGYSPSSGVLVLGRALAGLGAAGILSGGILIIRQSVQTSEQQTYIAVLFLVSILGLAIGPIIGGALTENVSWRWCFYINLLIGGLAIPLFLLSCDPASKISGHRMELKDMVSSLDLEGMLLFIPSVVCLLLALQYGGIKYDWSSAPIIVLFAVFIVTVVGFGVIQNYKNGQASLPSRILLNRNIYGGMVASFCLSGSFTVTTYYLPLWFQAIQNASPLQSGAMLLPLLLSTVIVFVASSIFIPLIGYYTPFVLFASFAMSIGAGLLTTLTDKTSSSAWIGYQIIFGIGAGCGMQQSIFAVQHTFKRSADISMGISMIAFAHMLGGAVALGIAQSAFENSLFDSVKAANVARFSAQAVCRTGLLDLKDVLTGGDLQTILRLYSTSIARGALAVAPGLAALSVLGGLAMDWHCVKGKEVLEFIYLL